uniref:hypothetical protein n=1 Tax=Alistipes sp. TaxID=1872444 RepID=UPI00405689AA
MKRYKARCNYKRGGGVPTYVSEISVEISTWWDTPIFEPAIDHTLQCIKQDIEGMEFSGHFTGNQLYMEIANRELRVYNRNRSAVIATITFEPINE